jgi:FkbM family methyltransferase
MAAQDEISDDSIQGIHDPASGWQSVERTTTATLGQAVIADLFLRTYRRDYQWLPYLFRSLNRHARGWRRLIIVVPEGQERDFPDLPELAEPEFCEAVDFATSPVYQNDYIGQQISKLRAWELTDADAIGYLDSDMVFTRPFVAGALPGPSMGAHPDGIGARPWSAAGAARDAWYEPTRDLLGFEPTHETMCRHPFVYRRETIQGCYEHAGGEEGLLDYVARTGFSEFNLLGNFAISRGCPTYRPSGPELQRQFRSYDGLTAEVREWLALNGYATRAKPYPTLHRPLLLPDAAFDGRHVVWDIGAGTGSSSLALALTRHRVVALEHSPERFEALARNLAGRDEVTCLCAAAGDSATATSASPDEQNVGPKYLERADSHVTVLLDDLARTQPAPDGIRLGGGVDVVRALRGASAILAGVRPALLIEVDCDDAARAELHDILSQCGYRMREQMTGDIWEPGDGRRCEISAKPVRYVGGNGAKPKLRILHNLARSGGTIVSRCLGCMDGVALLSEVHPTLWHAWNDPVKQARDWYGVDVPDDLCFVDTIAALEEAFRARGQLLVLRSWDFVDFIPSSKNRRPAGRSLLTEELRDRFELAEVLLARNPLAMLPSVERFLGESIDQQAFDDGVRAFEAMSSDEYCRGRVPFVEFLLNPEREIRHICSALELPYDWQFEDRWQGYTHVTGDIENQRERTTIGRKEPHA